MKPLLLLVLVTVVAGAQTVDDWILQSPYTSPSGRTGQAMTYDSVHEQVVLFGGQQIRPPENVNDTWTWNGFDWAEKSPLTSPPARTGAAMAYDSAHGQVVLFGGDTNAAVFLNDTWAWDGSNWTQKFPPTSPPALFSNAMAFDSGHSQVVLFAGGNQYQAPETWLWDGSQWTQSFPQSSPSARTGQAIAYDSAHSQVVLFGGAGTQSPGLLNDTWV
jgi:hypothetical protein